MLGIGTFGIVSTKNNMCEKKIQMDSFDYLHHIREWYIGHCFFPNWYKSIRLNRENITIKMQRGYGYLQSKYLRMTKLEALKKIALQLSKLHSQGIIHADIKPTNIVMKNNGTDIQLIDFGGSHIAIEPKKAEHKIITRWYRPPEASSTYTIAADMWSLGCVWYELVKETPLFICENDEELAICHEKYFNSKPFDCPILSHLICRVEDRWTIWKLLDYLNVNYEKTKPAIPVKRSDLLEYFSKQVTTCKYSSIATIFATDAMFDSYSGFSYYDLSTTLYYLELFRLPYV